MAILTTVLLVVRLTTNICALTVFIVTVLACLTTAVLPVLHLDVHLVVATVAWPFLFCVVVLAIICVTVPSTLVQLYVLVQSTSFWGSICYPSAAITVLLNLILLTAAMSV